MRLTSKGNITAELAVFIGVLFLIAIAAPIMIKVFSGINEGIQSTESMEAGKNISQQYIDKLPSTWDNMFLIICIGYVIAIIMAAVYVDTYPVFGIILLFILPFILVVGMVISNAYEKIQVGIPTETASLPFTIYIMNNLPYLILGLALLAGLALYAKRRLG